MNEQGPSPIDQQLKSKFGQAILAFQATVDSIPTIWIAQNEVRRVLRYLKAEIDKPYSFLYDLTAIDERARCSRNGQPTSDFTVVYHLLSLERNADARIKVALTGDYPTMESITDIWPSANWYEREVWDMFGIKFGGHPHLSRLLMPTDWHGHPLRKEHPSRATEMEPFNLQEATGEDEQRMLRFNPGDWGIRRQGQDTDVMFLNLGPQHPGTHGLLRMVLELDGEQVVGAVMDIGYHHRGAEKMAERQSWHTYIPYTDRIDYLGGVNNNLAYLLAVEKLAGIAVPERAQIIRVMMSELFRVASHLVWYGTFAQDVGALSPVFYMFSDRERIFDIVEAVCGGRMHPNWFRIGGVAQDLPQGWDRMVREFLNYMPKRLAEYDQMVMQNRIFKARTQGVGAYTKAQAVDWGVTGPGLRACGVEWDFRKKRPYCGYDRFEFDIPVGMHGDCYDRGVVRVEEMRQSLRIIGQCLQNMPEGPYKSDSCLTSPPLKERTMHDIETLIAHFLSVSWGPVVLPGEAFLGIEATKGSNGYYLVSDGNTTSYRTRIRTPSFPHVQMIPELCHGHTVADLLAIIGSVDYVLGDIDR